MAIVGDPSGAVFGPYATEDEVQQLADILASGGQSALLSAIRYRNDGQLRLGAMAERLTDHDAVTVALEARP